MILVLVINIVKTYAMNSFCDNSILNQISCAREICRNRLITFLALYTSVPVANVIDLQQFLK